MPDTTAAKPDETAMRVALWRALHLEVDQAPPVFEDAIGARLLAPEEPWRRRPDMDPEATRDFRAAIVARARFVEDLVIEQCGRGVDQYVILGAGLDTFAQRHPELSERLRVFEIDKPPTQGWKRRRLSELGFDTPDWPRFVPVDFEAAESWLEQFVLAGFNPERPAIIASTGVSLYLSREANAATMRQVATLAAGSILAMSYILPPERSTLNRPQFEAAEQGARAAGTPFVSFFTATQMSAMAGAAGFKNCRTVSAGELADRYFAGRSDGLRPPPEAEELLVAMT